MMKRLIVFLLAVVLCLPVSVSYGAVKEDDNARLKKMKDIEVIIDTRYKQFKDVEFYKTLEIEMLDPRTETGNYSVLYNRLSQENRKKFAKHYLNYFNKEHFILAAYNIRKTLERTKRYLENVNYLYTKTSQFDDEKWNILDKEYKKQTIKMYLNDYKNLKNDRAAIYGNINYAIKTMNKMNGDKETKNVIEYFNNQADIFKSNDNDDKWKKIEECLQLLNTKYSELN